MNFLMFLQEGLASSVKMSRTISSRMLQIFLETYLIEVTDRIGRPQFQIQEIFNMNLVILYELAKVPQSLMWRSHTNVYS